MRAAELAQDYHEVEKTGREYRTAQAAFEAAALALEAHLFAGTRPTTNELFAEGLARANLVAARRRLYAN